MPLQCVLPKQTLLGPASKCWTEYVYLLNSYHMVDLSWPSPIMCTIKFRISVKCQISYIFHQKLTCGSVSNDQFGK